MKSNNINFYHPEIDGLRGVSVLSVIAFHAFPALMPGGFIGVDVFFVISGFLISKHLFQSYNGDSFSLFDFYCRRVRRIFPALLVVLTLTLLFGWFFLLTDELSLLGKHVFSSAGFFINYILVNESSYFDIAVNEKPLLHLWSLAVEEQFYIIFPLVLMFFSRVNNRILIFFLSLLAISSYYFNVFYIEYYSTELFFFIYGRFWEFLVGVICSWFFLYKIDFLKRIFVHFQELIFQFIGVNFSLYNLSNISSVSGLLLLVYSVFSFNENLLYPSAYTLLPVVGAILIIASGPNAFLSRILLRNPILIWFGLISYPLYLFHWPILSFLHIIVGDVPHRNIRVAAIIVSIFLAWLTYRFIENPIRFVFLSRNVVGILILFLFVIGSFGFYLFKFDFERRDWVIKQSLLNQDLSDEYFLNSTQPDICSKLTNLDGEYRCASTRDFPTTVLLGDSHVPPLYYGLSSLYEQLDRGIAVLGGGGGCPPLYSVVSKHGNTTDQFNCVERITDTIDLIIETDFIEEVFLVSRGPLYTTGVGFGNYRDDYSDWLLHLENEVPRSRSNEDVFWLGLYNTVSELSRANKSVVYLFDVPELGFDVKTCVNLRSDILSFSKELKVPCSFDKKLYLDRISQFKALVNDVLSNFPNVRIIDLSTSLCDSASCFGGDGERLYYRDDDHLSMYGALYVVQSLRRDFIDLYD